MNILLAFLIFAILAGALVPFVLIASGFFDESTVSLDEDWDLDEDESWIHNPIDENIRNSR